MALPAMAQSFGNKRSVENDQQAAQNYITTQPFRSTSAMQGSGSVYSANPTVSADGSAYSPISSDMPNRGLRKTGTLPNEPDEKDDQDNTPIGDAVLPLMLMALAYLGMRVFRARKRA